MEHTDLVLRKDRIADTCHEHHRDEKWYECLGSHLERRQGSRVTTEQRSSGWKVLVMSVGVQLYE